MKHICANAPFYRANVSRDLTSGAYPTSLPAVARYLDWAAAKTPRNASATRATAGNGKASRFECR